MRSSSTSRVLDYARTGTHTLILRAQVANRKALQIPLVSVLGLAALGAGLWIRSCVNEHLRIANMVDPAGSCEIFRPKHILDTLRVTDQRREPVGFTVEDVKNILSAMDFRFTSGISEVRIVGDLRNPEDGRLVAGRYSNEDQSLEVSNNVVGLHYFRLVETMFHEVGHHVYWKLRAKGHDSINGFGENVERFAQLFAYYSMSSVIPDWKHYNSYDLNPPKAEEIEWLKNNIFCEREPDSWHSRNPNALSVFAKIYTELQKFDRLTDTLVSLSAFPIDPLATSDVRNYLAVIKGDFFNIDPIHLIDDLKAVAGVLDKVGITKEKLEQAADYFHAFGNQDFSRDLREFARTPR